MTPAKLNVFFAHYPYGGNGGISSEVPCIRDWFVKTIIAAKADPRVDKVMWKDFSDTPITLTRNASVLAARDAGADVLIMVDSDQHPDLLLGKDADAKPFFQSSFDFLYERRMKNRVTVIGAPYCGPPPDECVYVFDWASDESNHANDRFQLKMIAREHAAVKSGIQQVAALPTGLIMFDMKIFDVTDPIHEYDRLCKFHDKKVATALTKPWFYYEWTSIYGSGKASTEDVTCTRDMGLLATEKLGYSPLYCNWSSWAGHWKPKCVGKPVLVTSDDVHEKYRQAVLRGQKSDEKMVEVGGGGGVGLMPNRLTVEEIMGRMVKAEPKVNGQKA